MRDGFFNRLLGLSWGEIMPLKEAFQGVGDYLFGRLVETGAEVLCHELFTIRVEGQRKRHTLV